MDPALKAKLQEALDKQAKGIPFTREEKQRGLEMGLENPVLANDMDARRHFQAFQQGTSSAQLTSEQRGSFPGEGLQFIGQAIQVGDRQGEQLAQRRFGTLQ
jgi:hypothetical protein